MLEEARTKDLSKVVKRGGFVVVRCESCVSVVHYSFYDIYERIIKTFSHNSLH